MQKESQIEVVKNKDKIPKGTGDGDAQVMSDPGLQVASGIPPQLVPDFSRKLSIVEDNNNESNDIIIVEDPQGIPDKQIPAFSIPLSQTGDTDSVYAASTIACASEGATRAPRGPFVCSCGESFDRSVHLAAHKRWSCKLKEQKAQCDVCKHWFASDMGLKRHMKHAHGGMFSCDSCNLRFHNKIKLTRHCLEAHLDENAKNLKCYECGDTNFDNKFELECHLVLHKYERRQQKLTEEVWWTNPPHGHYSPYPSAPFVRPSPWECRFAGHSPRPPHRFGPPFWGRFPMGHPLRHPGHFMQRPPFPTPAFPCPRPPPPHSPFPETMMPYASHGEDESSVKSSSVTSTVQDTSTVMTESPSVYPGHEMGEAASEIPRHDHDYVEPTEYPYYCHMNHHYGHHFRGHHPHHHHGHHGKMKWKKYLKLMMKGKVPPLWPGMMPVPDPPQDEPLYKHARKEGGTDTEANTCKFKMACKFCDKIIERDKVAWHQRKECPVLSVHRCDVCDRVFRKRHFLIRHMHEQKHFGFSKTGGIPLGNTLADIDANTLSSLQEKMNVSLNLLNVSDSPANSETGKAMAGAVGSNADAILSQEKYKTRLDGTVQTSDSGLASQIHAKEGDGSHVLDKENRVMVASQDGNANLSQRPNFQCMTCRHVCQSIENLSEHLKEHINQVLAIQKVQEWTKKSSEYFFLGHDDDEDEFEGTGSVTTSTSFVDSEITSATGSTIPDVSSSNFSSLETAVLAKDPKWTRPHKKRSGHRQKGEITICEFCGDKFAFRKDLHFHMETRHKETTLECPVCKKKFSWKKRGQFYERHLKSHYGVKVFKHKCEACGKTFLENSKLRAHMSLHNNELLHKCGVCGKGYANKSSLVRHERKHTGVKPYHCDICQESFMEKRELLRHSTTHTGVAPFSCKECGQGFTLKTSLVSHMKKKHLKKKDKEVCK